MSPIPLTKRIPAAHHAGILACSLLLFAPAFIFGPSGFDLHTQSLWVRFFTQQFWAGEPYPRWLNEMFAGHGAPAFFYYPPLAYIVTALLSPFASLDPFGYAQIAASAWLATVIAGYSFYLWMRHENATPAAALTASALYMAAPVGIAMNFYHLMLFSSLWAYAFIPWTLRFSRRLAQGDAAALPGFALSLGLVMLCNTPSTVLCCIIVGGVALARLNRAHFKPLLLHFGIGTALAASLAAIYLLPAALYMPYVNMGLQWAEFVHWDAYPPPLREWMWLYWAALAALTLLYAAQTPKSPARTLAAALSGGSLLLALPFTRWAWEHLFILQLIQMPNRLFFIPAVCLAWLAAQAWPRLRLLAGAQLAAFLAAAALASYHTHYSMEAFAASRPDSYDMYQLNIDYYAFYLPGMDLLESFGTSTGRDALRQSNPRLRVLEGDPQIAITEWKPRRIVLEYQAHTPSVFLVRQLYYPGFVASDGTQALAIERAAKNGMLTLSLPAGRKTITIELTRMLPEIAGQAISALAAGLIVLLWLFQLRRRAH